ncbi:ubiquitin-protein ligase E3A isoform X1 [Lutzomyia longipalpis]|nr:ubiquitin-protein ligase E3A isoform X1 [Lutzomyia longipalpis]
MSSERQNKDDDSRASEGSSSSSASQDTETLPIATNLGCISSEKEEEMKRAAVKKRIERYFYQLLEGCGNSGCGNRFCASSGKVPALTPDQAAARALQLFAEEAKLCAAVHPSKVARTEDSTLSSSDGSMAERRKDEASRSQSTSHVTPSQTAPRGDTQHTTETHLDEDIIQALVETSLEKNSPLPLIRSLGAIFSSTDAVAASFRARAVTPIDLLLRKATQKDLRNLTKEDLRSLEGDLDKDEDSSCAGKETPPETHETDVDVLSLRRSVKQLFGIDDPDANKPKNTFPVFELVNNALQTLATSLKIDLEITTQREAVEDIIRTFVIVFEVICIAPAEFLEGALTRMCSAAANLPTWAQGRLAWIWARHCTPILRPLLESLQQIITLQVIPTMIPVQDNETIVNATKVMKILYYADILAGDVDPGQLREDDATSTVSGTAGVGADEDLEATARWSFDEVKFTGAARADPLAQELGVQPVDARRPFLPLSEFYNESLSDTIEMDYDYLNYKNLHMDEKNMNKKFCFMLYSFILTPATKTLALYYDSRIRMYSERRINLFTTHLSGQTPNPYLKLKVRREHLIDDALIELEMITMENPKDLKKQLVVEFMGEQGIDEGGVSKEFFQLIVEQIFNPDYGMFINQEDTNTMWFNSTSFENEAQFTLIGIVLGLAIYNNIILAVNFPKVVYRKLLGIRGSFPDLEDWNPKLYRSLKAMLEDEDSDMETVYMQTFEINYQDVFGNVLRHELKGNGREIAVTQDNKREFVDLYSDYLLNGAIERQFGAFRKGFRMVTDESPLALLFRPEEVELLVCGSKEFDFEELQAATDYDAGYTADTPVIKNFWEIVHALPVENQRQLLEFTTGSDRVPVGGLSRLKMVISRNGPDSDRLPTSHTCFNVLLLPEYNTKEKLKRLLLKAISYCKGFGML